MTGPLPFKRSAVGLDSVYGRKFAQRVEIPDHLSIFGDVSANVAVQRPEKITPGIAVAAASCEGLHPGTPAQARAGSAFQAIDPSASREAPRALLRPPDPSCVD